MSDFLDKIGLKAETALVLNCPKDIRDTYFVGNSHSDESIEAAFAVLFVYSKADVDKLVPKVVNCTEEAAKIWIAYPKKSGTIDTDLTRDKGWDILDTIGYRGISLVSLDSDWSVVRIRPKSEIKSKPKKLFDVPPPELVSQLEKYPQALVYYNQLAPSHRKEYNMWIAEAKREETKKRRLEKTIEMLLSGKKNPFVK